AFLGYRVRQLKKEPAARPVAQPAAIPAAVPIPAAPEEKKPWYSRIARIFGK
ncbi:MAG: hypothetical protein JNK48_18280, partial [Bryobacterales bacterium]|nr:hypothetical protein [Bryobacterales bacterium]